MKLIAKRKAKLFKFFGITKLTYLPYILNIEPGNICNLKCPLCPTGTNDPGLKKGFLTFELFKKIFDQLKGSLKVINMYSWGEPLLNKDFTQIIRYAKEKSKNIRIITSTSLNIKNREQLNNLLLSGIDEIIVSLDGATVETYEKYRVGGDFNLVMDNLKYLVQKRKELKKDTIIVWNFLVFKHNEHEVKKARKMAEDLGVTFRVGLMRTSMKDEILKPHEESIAKDIEWIPDNPEYSAYDKQKLAPKKKLKTCKKPWQEISVNWNGKVFACCAIYEEKYNIGDANTDSIRDIWNNALYVASRKNILGKKTKMLTVCSICKKHGFMHM